MGHLALARKYRPRQFDELVGQQALIRTLKNALSTGKVHPAYIFSGIRGVGKTTIARIFAKGLNCEKGVTSEPCDACASCAEIAAGRSMDVLEIDGATHTKVEEARDLTQLARYTPARDRYRVFIIDEVHMLSNAAFNALLKTMEEPPPHVVFLLATTEARKIPDTIQSRAQVFQFRPVPSAIVTDYLSLLSQKEGFEAELGALGLVARCGGGSVRDSLTLLDRLLAYGEGHLTEADAVEVLGVAGRESLFAFCEAFASGDAAAALSLLDDGLERGHDLERLLDDLTEHARLLLRAKIAPNAPRPGETPELAERLATQSGRFSPEDILRLLDLLAATQLRLKNAPDPRALLELQLTKAALLPKILPLEQLLSGVALPHGELVAPAPFTPSPLRSAVVPAPASSMSPSSVASTSSATFAAPSAAEDEDGALRFTSITPFQRMDESEANQYNTHDPRLEEFRKAAADRYFPAHALLEAAVLSLDPEGVLHIACREEAMSGFTYLNDAARREEMEALARAAGLPGAVSLEKGEAALPPPDAASPRPVSRKAPPSPDKDTAVKNVQRVFGGQIVSVTPLNQPKAGSGEESADEPE